MADNVLDNSKATTNNPNLMSGDSDLIQGFKGIKSFTENGLLLYEEKETGITPPKSLDQEIVMFSDTSGNLLAGSGYTKSDLGLLVDFYNSPSTRVGAGIGLYWDGNTLNSSVGGGGSVTSVGLTAPVGFLVTNSPIQDNGNINLSFESGYSLPTNTKQSQWDAAFSWGDHSQAGYLISLPSHNHDDLYYTEAEINNLLANSTQWDEAYSWGNHASAGYLISLPSHNHDDLYYTEAEINNLLANSTQWDTAYSWGNHASAGYLTSLPNHTHDDRYALISHTHSYNPTIGTDADLNTSGAQIIDRIYVTDGVITDMGARDLTLSDLGYLGDINANNYTHPNHTGEVTSSGDGAQTIHYTAISNKTNKTSFSENEDFLVEDGNSLYKVGILSLLDYMENNLSFSNNLGTITQVSTNTGLDGGASSGPVTISLNLSELSPFSGTINSSNDHLVMMDSGAERKVAFGSIPLSKFNNDLSLGTTSFEVKAGVYTNDIEGGETLEFDGLNGIICTGRTLAAGGSKIEVALSALTSDWNAGSSYSITANNFIGSSDISLKENIKELLYLSRLGTKYKSFKFKDGLDDRTHFGVVAQDLEKELPNLVYKDKYGIKSVAYQELHSYEIAYLKQENDLLKTQISLLEDRLSKIERTMNAH
jgi:hypothetical protein